MTRAKKVNLGAGTDYMRGWINVDNEPTYNPDVLADLRKRFPFQDNSIDEIKASDIIEHFTKEEGEKFLRECSRILKSNGRIFIRTHNIYQIFKQFYDDPFVLIHFLYGNTETTGVFGAHKYAYTEETARHFLKKIGLEIISFTTETTNFIIVAKKVKPPTQKPLFFAHVQAKKTNLLLTQLFSSLKKKGHLVQNISLRQLLKTKADIIIASTFREKMLATFFAAFTKKNIVWVEFDDLQHSFTQPLTFSKILYRFVNKAPKKVFVIGKANSVRFMMHTRVSLSKMVILSEDKKSKKIADIFLEHFYDCLL